MINIEFNTGLKNLQSQIIASKQMLNIDIIIEFLIDNGKYKAKSSYYVQHYTFSLIA